MSVNIPPVLHYIIYHNVTSDGDQGIMAYGTSVTIDVTDDKFEADAVYSIQVAAVNIIGQGSFRETTLCKCFLEFPIGMGLLLGKGWYSIIKCTTYLKGSLCGITFQVIKTKF